MKPEPGGRTGCCRWRERDLSRPSGTLPRGEGLVAARSREDDRGRWLQRVPPLWGGSAKRGRGPFTSPQNTVPHRLHPPCANFPWPRGFSGTLVMRCLREGVLRPSKLVASFWVRTRQLRRGSVIVSRNPVDARGGASGPSSPFGTFSRRKKREKAFGSRPLEFIMKGGGHHKAFSRASSREKVPDRADEGP